MSAVMCDLFSGDVRGFIHVCCLGGYREVTWEIIHRILESRLYDRSVSIEMAVLGSDADQRVVADMIRPFERFRIVFRSADLAEYEFPTLGLLQAACQTWDGPVYYQHTKGVSYSPDNQYWHCWRQLMLDEIVTSHERCLSALTTADTVGTHWINEHYGGNFWWAQASHIRRLPDILSLQRTPRPILRDPVWNLRAQCEYWLHMNPGRFARVGPSDGLDLHQQPFWTTTAVEVVDELLAVSVGRRFVDLSVELAAEGAGELVSGLPDGGCDVILVDIRDDPRRCLDVVEGCLPKLSLAGVVVLHHSNPPSAWHQRPVEEFAPGSEWTGQVWRAVVEFRIRHPRCEVFTVDTDWGCTVIVPGRRAQCDAVSVDRLDWATFTSGRAALLNLVGVAWFRRYLYAVPCLIGSVGVATRNELVNVLISAAGLDSYLHIAGSADADLGQVIAPVRQAVGAVPGATYRMTSDEFFSRGMGLDNYDLIYVDPAGDKSQQRRDLGNALARLSDRGWIVAHHNARVALADFRSDHPELEFWNLQLNVRFEEGCVEEGCVEEGCVEEGYVLVRARARARARAGDLGGLSGSATPASQVLCTLFCRDDPEQDPANPPAPRHLEAQPYGRNRDLLLAAIEANPHDLRSVLRLAEDYFEEGDFGNARTWFARAIEPTGYIWRILHEELDVALLRIAESMAQLGESWPDVQEAYLRAWEARPTRAEPLFELAVHHRAHERYQLGYLFAQRAAEIPFPPWGSCVGPRRCLRLACT